jgi:hypothetical protein
LFFFFIFLFALYILTYYLIVIFLFGCGGSAQFMSAWDIAALRR